MLASKPTDEHPLRAATRCVLLLHTGNRVVSRGCRIEFAGIRFDREMCLENDTQLLVRVSRFRYADRRRLAA